MKTLTFILTSLLLCLHLQAQDLEKIAKKAPIELSGGLRLSASMYRVSGRESSQSPFFWTLSGSPTVSLFGLKFPARIMLRESQLETNLNFPFNRFSMSPKWRWVQLHLGQRSPRLSPYTVQGADFSGLGLELNPKNLRFAFMRGTFRNLSTVADSLQDIATILPSYKRKGFAGKLGFGSANNYVDLLFSKIRDEEMDITNQSVNIKNPLIAPEDNLVLGVDAQLQLFKALTLKVNTAASLHTPNVHRQELATEEWLGTGLARSLSNLIYLNSSTRWGMAGDVELKLRLKPGSIGIKYHRVDPYFHSLGTFFVRKDVESWTGSMQLRTAKNKLVLNLRGGLEQNNLSLLRTEQQRRLIGSAHVLFIPSSHFSLDVNYSNFQMNNRPGLVEVDDTLRVVNVTQLQRAAARYRIPGAASPSVELQGSISHQQVDEQRFDPLPSRNMDVWSGSFRLGLKWKDAGLQLSPNLSMQQTSREREDTRTINCGIGLRQELFEGALRFNARATARFVSPLNADPRTDLNLRGGLRARLWGEHAFFFNINYLQRNRSSNNPNSVLRGNVGYSWSF